MAHYAMTAVAFDNQLIMFGLSFSPTVVSGTSDSSLSAAGNAVGGYFLQRTTARANVENVDMTVSDAQCCSSAYITLTGNLLEHSTGQA